MDRMHKQRNSCRLVQSAILAFCRRDPQKPQSGQLSSTGTQSEYLSKQFQQRYVTLSSTGFLDLVHHLTVLNRTQSFQHWSCFYPHVERCKCLLSWVK
jgi:hypothetical protein